MSKINIFGVCFDACGHTKLLEKVDEAVLNNNQIRLAFANPEFVVESQQNQFIREYLNESDYCLPDGMGVVWASRLLKKENNGLFLKERITGTDFSPQLLELCESKGYKLYILGGTKETSDKAKEKIKTKYPKLKLVTHHGFFKVDKTMVNKINKSKPDVLMVCMGMPHQERFIDKHQNELKTKVLFGNGGAIDFLAEDVKRAPDWMQKTGLEWVWRMTQDFSGRRLARQSSVLVFIWLIIVQKAFLTAKK